MTTATKSKATTSAVAEVTRLHEREHALDAEMLAIAEKIDTLDQAARVATRDGGSVRQQLEAKQRAAVDRETARYAVDHVRALRREQIPRAWAERAATMRSEAAELDAQAAELDRQAQPHLDALRAIMGTPYILRARFEALAARTGSYVESPSPQPRTDQLRDEATTIRERASHEDQRRFELRRIFGGTVDELIDQATKDPYDFAPARHEIRAWVVSQVEAQQVAERRASNAYQERRVTAAARGLRETGIATLRYRLEWNAGVILPASGIA